MNLYISVYVGNHHPDRDWDHFQHSRGSASPFLTNISFPQVPRILTFISIDQLCLTLNVVYVGSCSVYSFLSTSFHCLKDLCYYSIGFFFLFYCCVVKYSVSIYRPSKIFQPVVCWTWLLLLGGPIYDRSVKPECVSTILL